MGDNEALKKEVLSLKEKFKAYQDYTLEKLGK